MSKWYQAKILNVQYIMVEVADDKGSEEARLLAEDFTPFEGESEITLLEMKESDVDSGIRHADDVVFIKDYE